MTFVKYGLGFALLGVVIWWYWEPSANGPGLKDALARPLAPFALLAAVGLCLIALLLTFYRWYLLVRALDLPFTVHDALRLGMIGFALSALLPSSIGGDVIKAAFLAREQSRRTAAVATVVFDRIIGLCALFWLAALLGSVFWLTGNLTDPTLVLCVGVAVALSAVTLLSWLLLGLLSEAHVQRLAGWLSSLPKVGGPLAELWRAVWMYRRRGRSVGLGMTLALIGHVGFVLTYYFAALAILPVEQVPDLAAQFTFVPVGMIAQAGIPMPGGIGVGEAFFGWFYTTLGFAGANGVLECLLQRVVGWSLALAGYLFYLRMRPSLQGIETEAVREEELATVEV
jgi:uncharacterized protein (TIRG00374 family)